ncbi:MAG: hypothetical protein FWE08_00165 [Oscillospiraceae bacterium]|nr:hypothetical protein [Oscillospiraceae bacterium]
MIHALEHFAARIRQETAPDAHLIIPTLAVLYGSVMRIDPKNPDWPERDKLVLSNPQAAPALHAALTLLGYFPTELPPKSTGSLSAATALAAAGQADGKGARTYLILEDGAYTEEPAKRAAAQGLGNLIAFADTAAIGAKFAAADWHVQTIDGREVAAVQAAVTAAQLVPERPSCIVLNI